MNKTLVIGASGQLGSAVLDQLQTMGQDCRVFIRPSSNFTHPPFEFIEVAKGDLSDFPTINDACIGITTVISTASSIIPRKGDKFGADEVENYHNLIRSCKEQNVKHIIYISAFSSDHDEVVPEFKIKRQIEQLITKSGIPFTIFRAAAFMDIYYAVMGSSLVMKGVSQPTLLRGFWLAKLYSRLTSGLLENTGIALLPGNGNAKQAFISIHDVASFMVKALSTPTAKNRIIELGGPEALSWRDVADIYADVLGVKIRKLCIPSFILNTCRASLHPFSPAGENIMSILFLLSRYDVTIDMTDTCEEFSINLTTTREYLLQKSCI